MTQQLERRNNAGRRDNDLEVLDLITRMALSEQDREFIKEEVVEVKHMIKGHIDDEYGDIRNLTKAINHFTEIISGQTVEMRHLSGANTNLASAINAINLRMDEIETRQADIEKKYAQAEAAGKTAWVIGGIVATAVGGIITAIWQVFTYFKG